MSNAPDKKLLTIQETTHYLGIGKTAIFELMAKGALTRIKIGRSTRLERRELDAFIDRAAGREV